MVSLCDDIVAGGPGKPRPESCCPPSLTPRASPLSVVSEGGEGCRLVLLDICTDGLLLFLLLLLLLRSEVEALDS
jgi:hypothetical protein